MNQSGGHNAQRTISHLSVSLPDIAKQMTIEVKSTAKVASQFTRRRTECLTDLLIFAFSTYVISSNWTDAVPELGHFIGSVTICEIVGDSVGSSSIRIDVF